MTCYEEMGAEEDPERVMAVGEAIRRVLADLPVELLDLWYAPIDWSDA